MESSSSAFIAVVSGIEALIEKKSETCPECRQPKFGVTKKFEKFLKEHVPNIQENYPNELKQIYQVRSGLAHGVDLLWEDREYWNFFGEPRQQWLSSKRILMTLLQQRCGTG
jgi:hypothetical protein